MKIKYLLIILVLTSQSILASEKQIDPKEIQKNLRCLVCQGQSISDSNSDFAQTIKMVVDDLINEGLTEEEIYSFMSDKYGEWIVFKPQLNIQNLLLWILPYMALILGGFFIIKLFNKKNKIAK
jgi:cytochrome c-type biogenesis protein CcmH